MTHQEDLIKIIKANIKPHQSYSNFATWMDIWEDIVIKINSTKGKEQKYWGKVMDLFKETYPNSESEELSKLTEKTKVLKIGNIATGINYSGEIIIGKYDGKMIDIDGEHKGYWIWTYAPSYEDCPREDYHRILHEIKEIIE
jgi:hypothetical protein